MEIHTTVEIEQFEWVPVECEFADYHRVTQAEGVFRTAEEHGCRPRQCARHWKREERPAKKVCVHVTIKEHEIARALGRKAATNRTGRATEFSGLIRARTVR